MIAPELDANCVTTFEYRVGHKSASLDNHQEYFPTRSSGTIDKRTNLYRFPSENVITYASIIPPKTNSIDRLQNFYRKILKNINMIGQLQLDETELTIYHYQFGHQLELTYHMMGNDVYLTSYNVTHMEGNFHKEEIFIQ